MKLLLKYMVNTVGLVSGTITIAALFVKPEVIGEFLYQNVRLAMIFDLVSRYSEFVILIPLVTGITFSGRYGGFSFPRFLIDLPHLLSSFVMFEFWLGFAVGVKYVGYLVIPIASLLLLKAML